MSQINFNVPGRINQVDNLRRSENRKNSSRNTLYKNKVALKEAIATGNAALLKQ